jgi:hypothetical protein
MKLGVALEDVPVIAMHAGLAPSTRQPTITLTAHSQVSTGRHAMSENLDRTALSAIRSYPKDGNGETYTLPPESLKHGY